MRRTLPRALAAAATCLAAATASLTSAHAVTKGGVDDTGAYPMVGLMSAQTEAGEPLWRCSGTLIDPTTFITAGHCTSDDEGGSVGEVRVWFGDGPYPTSPEWLADVEDGDDPSCIVDGTADQRHPGYPCSGGYTGEAFTHPSYDPGQFWLWDVGVVKLDTAVQGVNTFGSLPEVGAYDDWAPKRKQRFTSVGYGLQKAVGQGASAQGKDDAVKKRMVAHPRLILVNRPYVGDYNMQLSNNANTGGTCFGDSGGPNFLGMNPAANDYEIVGVTSYGMSAQTCGGIGGLYRLDREVDRPWLTCVIDAATEAEARACTLAG